MIYQFKILLFASCIVSTLCFPNSSGPSNTEASSSEIPKKNVTVLEINESRMEKKLLPAVRNDNGLIYYRNLAFVSQKLYGMDINKNLSDEEFERSKNSSITLKELMALFRISEIECMNKLAEDLQNKAKDGYIALGDAREIFEKHNIDKEIRSQTLYKVKSTKDHILKLEDLIKVLK